jgi:outer membrane protein assembly factor BamD (BamD/ComL family)
MPVKIRKKTPQNKMIVQPKELMGFYTRLTFWVEEHYKNILIGVAVILVVGAVAVVYGILNQRHNQQAALLESEASRHFSAIRPTMGSDNSMEYGKALALYQGIVSTYPGTKGAAVAQYYVGNAYRKLKQWDKAIVSYRDFLKKYPSHRLVPSVYLSLGYTYLENGKAAEAIAEFEAATRVEGAPIAAQASFEAGRAYELSQNTAKATAQFEAVKKDYPGTPWAQEAVVHLSQLKKAGGG